MTLMFSHHRSYLRCPGRPRNQLFQLHSRPFLAMLAVLSGALRHLHDELKQHLCTQDLAQLAAATKKIHWKLMDALSVPNIQCMLQRPLPAQHVQPAVLLAIDSGVGTRPSATESQLLRTCLSRFPRHIRALNFDLPLQATWLVPSILRFLPEHFLSIVHVGFVFAKRAVDDVNNVPRKTLDYGLLGNFCFWSFRIQCRGVLFTAADMQHVCSAAPLPQIAMDVALHDLADPKVAIAALDALHAAYALNLTVAAAAGQDDSMEWPLQYNISISMHAVASDDHWEDIIGAIADALETYVLWKQLGNVVVILGPANDGQVRGAYTWQL